ncbi:shikimate dehydrogenase family protein [Shimia biformata]|uniref:shikimate dehydrogenase family protein n=1 Tax=Shimia biformata TaxID=1294299 RepID=UPI0019513254|nr:shikimate dehydrogenase [Shimia biformata]
MTTITCGLIGEGLSRSRFGTALGMLGAHHGYEVAFHLIDTADRRDFDLVAELERLREAGWTGVSVTHPYKSDAAVWADAVLDDDIRRIGATNLVLFKPETRALNTDFSGFRAAWLDRFGDQRPGHAAMAGAGGVAGALGVALLSLGAESLTIWDTDPVKAETLAARLGPKAQVVPIADASEVIRSADGLVNATPLGMGTDRRSAFPPEAVAGQKWAFDAVYTPVETTFLSLARKQSLSCLTGFDMFRFMAVDSFAAYSGLPADPALAGMLEPLRPKDNPAATAAPVT